MSGSIVEYDGFLSSSALAINPAVQFDAPNLSLGGQGSWTVFESGNQIIQTSAAAGWFAPAHEHWRMELSGAAGVSRYADQGATGHLLARARLHFFGNQQGSWLSATTGASFGDSADTPFELGIGGWSIRNRLSVVGTLTGAWLRDQRHVDIAGAVRWTGRFIELESRFGARPWHSDNSEVTAEPARVWGELAARIPVASRISLAVSGGSYPSDPVRRVLGARYVTAGVQLDINRVERAKPIAIPAVIAAALAHNNPANASSVRIQIAPAESSQAIRIQVAGAANVELMGDFTDWQPMSLIRVSPDVWALELPLVAGVYRMTVRVDGGPWLVPTGARSEQDEYGGTVGVIVVR